VPRYKKFTIKVGKTHRVMGLERFASWGLKRKQGKTRGGAGKNTV